MRISSGRVSSIAGVGFVVALVCSIAWLLWLAGDSYVNSQRRELIFHAIAEDEQRAIAQTLARNPHLLDSGDRGAAFLEMAVRLGRDEIIGKMRLVVKYIPGASVYSLGVVLDLLEIRQPSLPASSTVPDRVELTKSYIGQTDRYVIHHAKATSA